MGAAKRSGARTRAARNGGAALGEKNALPKAAGDLEKILLGMLGSAQRETSAIEALDEYFETDDPEALDRARELLKESLELLRGAQKDLDELLAACLISYEYWKAITDQIRGARKYDRRAANHVDEDYSGIVEPVKWLRLALEYKDIGVAMLKDLRSQAVGRG